MLCNIDVLWIHKIYLLKLFEYSDLPAICKIHNVIINKNYTLEGASLVAQTVKNLPAMQESRVQSLGLEDPLWRRKWFPHSSILAWRIPWAEDPGGLQHWSHKELDMTR